MKKIYIYFIVLFLIVFSRPLVVNGGEASSGPTCDDCLNCLGERMRQAEGAAACVGECRTCGRVAVTPQCAQCSSCVENTEQLASVCYVSCAVCDPELSSKLTTEAKSSGSADPQFVKLTNPLAGNVTDITVTFGKIVGAAIGVIGGLTLLMFVWGGFLWLTSAGNPERVKQGTQTMLWAAIGVILVFSSYLLLTTFMNYLRPGS